MKGPIRMLRSSCASSHIMASSSLLFTAGNIHKSEDVAFFLKL